MRFSMGVIGLNAVLNVPHSLQSIQRLSLVRAQLTPTVKIVCFFLHASWGSNLSFCIR